MSGLQDNLTTKEPRGSKRLERSCLEAAAAAPPARRTRRAKGTAPPREREASVLAASAARSPSPPQPEQDSRDVTPAPPPPKRDGSVPAARVARAPSPPCGDRDPGYGTVAYPPAKREWPRTAYKLRNRLVPDTRKPKPMAPMPTPRLDEKSFREKRKHGPSWQTAMCARVGLKYYNSMNQGDEHELVKAVSSNAFVFNGIWYHANFLAKRKGATNCVDLVPKYFFAELVTEMVGHSCVSCVKLEPGDPKNLGGCRLCSENMMHPAGGRYRGAQPRPVRHAPGGLQISFSF